MEANETDQQPLDDKQYEAFMYLMRKVVQRYSIPVVAVIGVLTNTLAVIVLTRKSMKSSTNCYLTALAIFDALYILFNFSLSLMHQPGMLENHTYIDYVPWGFPFSDLCSNTSVWLVVSFTIERYIVVCHPLRGKALCTITRAKIVIVSVFCFALACILPTFFEWTSGWETDQETNETYYFFFHTDLGKNPSFQDAFYWFTGLTFSLIPILLLIIFNGFLMRSVHQAQRQRRKMTMTTATKHHGASDSNQETRITIMLIVIVVVFLICQLPSAVLLIWSKDMKQDSPKQKLAVGLNNISNFLMALNATCNFFLYCFLSEKFRQTLMELLFPCCKCTTRRKNKGAEYMTKTTTVCAPHRIKGRPKPGDAGKRYSWNPLPENSDSEHRRNSYEPMTEIEKDKRQLFPENTQRNGKTNNSFLAP